MNMYILEVNTDGKIRHIAINQDIVADQDITDTGLLIAEAKKKFGLLPEEKAEVIGLQTFVVSQDGKEAIDTHGMKWKYIPDAHHWEKI